MSPRSTRRGQLFTKRERLVTMCCGVGALDLVGIVGRALFERGR